MHKRGVVLGWVGRLAGWALWWAATLAGAAPAGPPASMPAGARWAALADTPFRNFTQDAGLPGPLVTALAEDGAGFLWVGTQAGLARWDGYRFRIYRPDPTQVGSLPDNWVQVLHTDTQGRLWVGTNGGGLARYEPGTDRFTTYAAGPQGLSHVFVHAIADDGSGGLWVGTDGGLDHVPGGSGPIEHLRHVDGDAVSLPSNRVTAVLPDRHGNLWVGTQAGLVRRIGTTGAFEPVVLSDRTKPASAVRSLLVDAKGRMWVGTMGQGVFVVSGLDGPTPALRVAAPDNAALASDRVLAIEAVGTRDLWLGTYSSGIVVVDLETLATRAIRNNPMQSDSLPNNTVWALQTQRSGLTWVGHGRGLSRHDPAQTAVLTVFGAAGREHGISDADVTSVLPLAYGRVWLGLAANGVDILDPHTQRVAQLRPGADPRTSLARDFVWNMAATPQGAVYLGTLRGLYRTERSGQGVRRLPLSRPNPGASVDALHLDGSTLWMGSWGDGLWALDVSGAGDPTVLRHESAERLTDRRINAIEKSGTSLWIGTANGLNRLDLEANAVEHILPEPARADALGKGSITSLLTDAQRRLWVSTLGGGISVLIGHDTQGHARFQRITTAEGLPNNNVDKLLTDAGGTIWASTDDGLARIDARTLAVRALKREDGVQISAYWGGAGARSTEGELLFGGGGGLTIVRPERLVPWRFVPPVVVTDVRVGEQPVNASRFNAAPGAPRTSTVDQGLVVEPDANSLAVEFAALDLSAPERNRYAYRLDGFDRDWIATDANRRLAAYTNLPPGHYTLRLRGSNRNGEWAERDLQLPITVRPAWYQTLWFRALELLTAVLAVYGIVQARTRYLRRVQHVLEAKVAERTTSLRATAQALEEKTRALEDASLTDPLTGLRNRRFLSLNIDTEIALHLRRHVSAAHAGETAPDADLIFFLIDIDHFKHVNDHYGHAAGDAVLAQMRARLQRVFRDSDFLVRWGGEEFLVVARSTHREQGPELAERMRQSVCSEDFVLDDGRPLHKTCSIGYAFFPFGLSDPAAVDWTHVVEFADAGLYAAKHAGRDGWVGVVADPQLKLDAPFATRALADVPAAVGRGELHWQSLRPIDALTN